MKKSNETESDTNKKVDHEVYLYAHKNFSYKDAVEFIRLATRKAE